MSPLVFFACMLALGIGLSWLAAKTEAKPYAYVEDMAAMRGLHWWQWCGRAVRLVQ